MLVRLLLLFTVVPLVELALLLLIADYTSWQFTLGLVLVSGVAGAALSRYEGLRAWQRVHEMLDQGKVPGDPLLDAVLVLVAGALLITPGVLTDLAGLVLLVPPTRALVKRWLKRRFKTWVHVDRHGGKDQPSAGGRDFDARVIDVHAEEAEEDEQSEDVASNESGGRERGGDRPSGPGHPDERQRGPKPGN
jgi:UPF0716 protein FxsA